MYKEVGWEVIRKVVEMIVIVFFDGIYIFKKREIIEIVFGI